MNSPNGLTALAAVAIAIVSLIASAILAMRLRRLQAAQSVLLPDGRQLDLIEEAAEARRAMEELIATVDLERDSTVDRFASVEEAVSGSISGFSLVRYDAFDEASGRQSLSVALVDGRGEGVVLSSLVRRESARTYARLIGDAEHELSPEETEAVRIARERSASR